MVYKILCGVGILTLNINMYAENSKELDIGVQISATGTIGITEAPLNASLNVSPKYVGVAAGIAGGTVLLTNGIAQACNALTQPSACTHRCKHAGLLSDDTTTCPDKQTRCWRMRTPQCHRATGLLVMGTILNAAAFTTAYLLQML